jgi:hypothetical protein
MTSQRPPTGDVYLVSAAGTRIGKLGLLGSILVAAMMLVGCAQTADRGSQATGLPTQPPVPTTPPAPPTPTENPTTQGGGAVPPALVGTWTQDSVSSSTFYFSRKAYQFNADGTYALLDLLCSQDSNGTTCEQADPPEAGVATVNGNQLSLSPQTQSTDGPRTYVFAVVRDPNLGDLRLQFQMPDYVDEWFWQP